MIVATFTDDFSVTWTDPADAKQSWQLAGYRPLAPMSREVDAVHMSAVFACRSVYVNGYPFRSGFGWTLPRVPADLAERSNTPAIWAAHYLPRAKEICERMRAHDYESLSPLDAALMLDVVFNEAAIAFRYTMLVRHLGEFELTDFCRREMGPEGTEFFVQTLLQGHESETSAVGVQLAELADMARSRPQIEAAIRASCFEEIEASVGDEFLNKFEEFLHAYGWMAQDWGLAHVPTLAEQPTTALSLIRRYLLDPDHTPLIALRRSAAQRADAVSEAERRLDGAKLDEFRRLLDACKAYVFLSESRYHWIATIWGSVRVPVLVLGRKLVAAGVLAEPDDAFFLSLAEAKAAAAEPRSFKAVIARRRADLERWERLTPPAYIGAEPGPDAMPARDMPAARREGGSEAERRIIQGEGASKGIARGVARVIHSLADAERLEAGDILVANWTAAPWTPLFAIAAGVVTDSGGLLSHPAICAREYAIPCVVGTRDGTQRIPDGALITIDGSKGTVVIER